MGQHISWGNEMEHYVSWDGHGRDSMSSNVISYIEKQQNRNNQQLPFTFYSDPKPQLIVLS